MYPLETADPGCDCPFIGEVAGTSASVYALRRSRAPPALDLVIL